jgi:sialic acid synthase SpsE
LAQLLVKGALLADADAVKLQLIFADELCVPSYYYYDLFKSLEMEEAVWHEIVRTVHDAGKYIYLDVYGNRSLELAVALNVDGVKISTTDFYNKPLIKNSLASMSRVFISIGGVSVADLDELTNFIDPKKVTLMFGFQAEPTEVGDNNLSRIRTIKDRYKEFDIGFMDHSLGSSDEAFWLPLMALGVGATCIEKHITLDYSLQIEDYISALTVDRFGQFIKMIKYMELAMGNDVLSLSAKEIEYKNRAGKVVVANRDLPKGTVIKEGDVVMKRFSTEPAEGYINQVSSVIGCQILTPINKNRPVKMECLE